MERKITDQSDRTKKKRGLASSHIREERKRKRKENNVALELASNSDANRAMFEVTDRVCNYSSEEKKSMRKGRKKLDRIFLFLFPRIFFHSVIRPLDSYSKTSACGHLLFSGQWALISGPYVMKTSLIRALCMHYSRAKRERMILYDCPMLKHLLYITYKKRLH